MSFLLNPYRFGAPVVPASFPVVESVTGQSFSSNASSFDVDLPETVDGDLLWLHLTVLNSGTITAPGDWTALRTSTVNIFSAKIADGTEGGTSVTISKTSTSTTAASQIIRVSNWSGIIADIENAASSTITDESVFDPPNLAPSYGAGNTLWIAAYWAQFNTRTAAAYPDDTVNQNHQHDGSGGSRCELGCATRELNAASWNPTEFVASGSQQFAAAFTFAIKAAA